MAFLTGNTISGNPQARKAEQINALFFYGGDSTTGSVIV
jgi:hypothetical protein